MRRFNLKGKVLKGIAGATVLACTVFGAFDGNVMSKISETSVALADDPIFIESYNGLYYAVIDKSYVEIRGYYGNGGKVVIPEKMHLEDYLKMMR